jgi:hypothetical protein
MLTIFTRCDKVVPGLGATNLLLLLPVSEFWSFYTQFSIFHFFDNFFDNLLTTFWQLFGNFLTTFWQLFDNFLTTFWKPFDNFLTTFWQLLDNFWKLLYKLYNFVCFLFVFKSYFSWHLIFLYLSILIVATGLRTIQFLFVIILQPL